MMPESSDRFEELLRAAFKAGVPEPEYEADYASPETVPLELKARALEETRQFSTRLLARRLCAAGEEAGRSIDDLASEAVGAEEEAKRLLLGNGTPLALEPKHLARMFFRAGLDPAEWEILLFQAVASQASYRQAPRGQIWGRTTGLSDLLRAERLSGTGPQFRDPAWAERVARNFVDEVLGEWKKLASGMR
jgi:hypothetical protein